MTPHDAALRHVKDLLDHLYDYVDALDDIPLDTLDAQFNDTEISAITGVVRLIGKTETPLETLRNHMERHRPLLARVKLHFPSLFEEESEEETHVEEE